jgi:hypothetical protein
LPTAGHADWIRAAHPGPGDARDIGSCLRALDANANGIRLIVGASAADFDIVAAVIDVGARKVAQANVVAARGVEVEGAGSAGSIFPARGVALERGGAEGAIPVTAGVELEGVDSAGSILKPVVLLNRALNPNAVSLVPVVLCVSVPVPQAVLFALAGPVEPHSADAVPVRTSAPSKTTQRENPIARASPFSRRRLDAILLASVMRSSERWS